MDLLTKPENNFPISLDTLLLCVLIVFYLTFNQLVSALLVLAVGIYASGDLYITFKTGSQESQTVYRQRLVYKVKFPLLILIIGIAVVGPTLYHMMTRANGEPDEHLHDGAFQTEVALRYLLNGKNPYAETYFGTGLERYTLADAPENPALYNFVYFPFLLWISFPFYWLSINWFQWYDQRMIYLLSFVVLIFLLTRLTKDPNKKSILLILLTLNVYSSGLLERGFSDWIVLTFLVGMVVLLKQGRLSLASLALGMACASKPSAWFILPFFALFVLGNFSLKSNLQFWTKQAALSWIIPLMTITPFLIWNAEALYRSVVGYTLGFEGTVPYPIRGFGIGTWLLALKIIPSPLSLFPFWILEILVGLPALFFLLHYQLRKNTINTMLLCYAGFFLISAYFSRFFQGNYLLFGLWIVLLACFSDSFQFRRQLDPISEHIG